MARNKDFHSQGREGHLHHSKGFYAHKLTSFLLKSFERMIGLHIRATGLQSGMPHRETKGKEKPPWSTQQLSILRSKQSSELTAEAFLTEQMREMRALTGRTTSMNTSYKKAIRRAKRTE